jgi:hypothetical protein
MCRKLAVMAKRAFPGNTQHSKEHWRKRGDTKARTCQHWQFIRTFKQLSPVVVYGLAFVVVIFHINTASFIRSSSFKRDSYVSFNTTRRPPSF